MIRPRNLIVEDDIKAVDNFLRSGAPLSGYLAGNPHGGAAIQRLEEIWAAQFGRRHAIACNSATSGLLAACAAAGIGGQSDVAVPALSMSATAAVPLYLNATLRFMDVDAHGCATLGTLDGDVEPDAAIVTTLLGHPIDPRWMGWEGTLIIDNAQGVMSATKVGDKMLWSEQMGAITVTSFNVHKQINAGEMGMITTDDDIVAGRMRAFINHGEFGAVSVTSVGLNLRPTELSAVLALSQLSRIEHTINNFEWISQRITDNMPSVFKPIGVADGARSGRYCYGFLVHPGIRDAVVNLLTSNGVPAIPMMQPLYELPAFERYYWNCNKAELLAEQGVIFELTLWRYEDDISLVGQMLRKAATL